MDDPDDGGAAGGHAAAAAVVTAVPLVDVNVFAADSPPRRPEDDRNAQFEWIQCSFNAAHMIELQSEGFTVVCEIANGYAMLRRRRTDLSDHRFATASSVTVTGRVLPLGACRIGAKYVTRDVFDPHGASLTMIVAPTGEEVYVFNRGEVAVSFS